MALFPFFNGRVIIFHCVMLHVFFICFSVDRHLSCFLALTVVNSAAMNTEVRISLQAMLISGFALSLFLNLLSIGCLPHLTLKISHVYHNIFFIRPFKYPFSPLFSKYYISWFWFGGSFWVGDIFPFCSYAYFLLKYFVVHFICLPWVSGTDWILHKLELCVRNPEGNTQ